MTTAAGDIRIGISGWRYKPWRGVFYPERLPQHAELAYASRVLNSVEINGSFYSLQRPESFTQWREATPADFRFAVKGPRYITHMLKLKNSATPLANFFASGVFNLRHKLGPILWQLPPMLRYDHARLAEFIELLPTDTRAAAKLARKHDQRLAHRNCVNIDKNRSLQHALEIRHESFLDNRFIELLRSHNVALVIAETAQRWPLVHDITADFVYMRLLHGDTTLYQSGYSSDALDRWAKKITAWSRGVEPRACTRISTTRPQKMARPVYCYFDNTDIKLRAPFDAQSLMKKRNMKPGVPVVERA